MTLFRKDSIMRTEQEVLDALGIEDFRHVSKDKLMSFCSQLDKIDPEVAKAALAQFPEFSKSVKDMLSDISAQITRVMDSEDESQKMFFDSSNKIIDALTSLLDKEGLDKEERFFVIDSLKDIQDKLYQKDTENKKFKGVGIGALVTVFMAGVGVLIAALGGKADIDL